jgi:hypothetical protein
MVRKFATSALFALTTLTVSAPAAAESFDAFSSFNATQGAGGFSYGSFDGTTFTPFTQSGGCVVSGVTCLRGPAAILPSVFKADGSLANDGTVLLATDRLIAHPGEFADSLYIAFTAPFAGSFTYSVQFNQQDSNTARNSVGITEFFRPVSGPVELYAIGTVNESQPSLLTGFTQTVAAGDVIGYIIDKNGVYFNDSTGFNFTLTADAPAVPEPASWAMMIIGFGAAGGALRRRNSARTLLGSITR